MIEACKVLKDQGYTLALDDFVFHPKYRPLIALADIIKVGINFCINGDGININKTKCFILDHCQNQFFPGFPLLLGAAGLDDLAAYRA